MSEGDHGALVDALVRAAVLEAQAKDAASFESYRLRQENAQLREALRALILAPPWKQSRGSADVWCEWCDATTYGGASVEHFHDLGLHEQACPWRKARVLLGLDGRALD